jgi:sortase A
MRRLERFLFTLGVALLGVFLAASGYAWFSQSYYNWAFERLLKGQSASLVDYASHFFKESPAPVVKTAPARKPTLVVTPGGPIGRLEIPSVDLSVMVLEGTDEWTLNKGAGHVEGTALPGNRGNFAIAAHRDTFFRPLKNISKDDVVTVTTVAGSYQYKVERTRVVLPSNTSVLEYTEPATLTLITCYPFYYVGHAPKRFIVQARLVGAS